MIRRDSPSAKPNRFRRALICAVAIAAASSLAGTAPAHADVPGVGSNLSSELGLPDLIGGLEGLLRPKAQPSGTSRCTSVIQIGDSTSVSADDPSAVPAADTAKSRYGVVGARSVVVDAVSGRAIGPGPGPDAEQAVRSRLASGARGCWVIAMGVNDVGSIATGSSVGADARIDRIMRQLAGQPVLWPTVTSSNPAKPAFSTAAMTPFNDALRRATGRYPNLAVYDWAGAARPTMFASDGIHYTSAGTAERNRRFATALATAYPAGTGTSPAVRWVTG